MEKYIKRFLNKYGYYTENQIIERLMDVRYVETPFGEPIKITKYECKKMFGWIPDEENCLTKGFPIYKGKFIEVI